MVGKIGGQYTEIKAIALKIDTKDWFQIKVLLPKVVRLKATMAGKSSAKLKIKTCGKG